MVPVNVNGYLVVRKPDQNYDDLQYGSWPRKAPQLRGTFYSGIDRMGWFDVNEDFFAGSLPPDITKLRDDAIATVKDHSGIRDCQDLEIAKKLLEYSNRESSRNELIAFYSDELNKYKGFVQHEQETLEFLGYDFTVIGEWSLIEAGIFVQPAAFSQWLPELNEHGLFSTSEYLSEYANTYFSAAEQGQVEPLGSDPIVTAIQIFRIL